MLCQVSFGEALDKLSILEIKRECIIDTAKLAEVQKEIDALHECRAYLQDNRTIAFLYRLMKWVNKRVWDFTNEIKAMSHIESSAAFANLSHIIFEHNQYRFRCKNMLNALIASSLKEQKSYKETSITLDVDDKECLYKVYAACLLYDKVVLTSSTFDACATPNIVYDEKAQNGIKLSEWNPSELPLDDPIFRA